MKREKKGNEIHMKQSKTMLEGSEWKLILLFTLPLMAGNLLQQLYNTVDGIVVGNFVGETALAAVGTCAPLTMLFTAIALGMSNGAAVVVSQFYGAGRMNEMKKAVASSLILLFGMGVVLSILGCVLSGWLLRVVLGVQEYLLPQAELYFRIYAIGLLAQFIYNIVAAILRSMGDSRATLYFLLVSAVCNILLDMLAVIALGWGVMGVAVATVVSQILSAAVSVVYLFHRYTSLRFAKGDLRFDGEMGMLILKMGIPSTLQQCVVSMGHMAIQRVINHFDITAGYTAATRIESTAVKPIPMSNFILLPPDWMHCGFSDKHRPFPTGEPRITDSKPGRGGLRQGGAVGRAWFPQCHNRYGSAAPIPARTGSGSRSPGVFFQRCPVCPGIPAHAGRWDGPPPGALPRLRISPAPPDR